ncbi:MAG: cyclic nucleotide-binding domain-containing protein [Desulfobacterales bacterium]|nr:cyclic nucleotide-binding domain-containing protein [Desulfobacterales bacterium]
MLETDYIKDNEEVLNKLRQIPAFERFDEAKIKGLLKLSKLRQYDPGEAIIKEGNFENWIYFLISGKVKIIKQDEAISILQRTGDIFGEMSIIDGSARSASVYALDKSVCLASDASYIDRISGEDQLTFCYILFRLFSEILAERLRKTNEEVIALRDELDKLKNPI